MTMAWISGSLVDLLTVVIAAGVVCTVILGLLGEKRPWEPSAEGPMRPLALRRQRIRKLLEDLDRDHRAGLIPPQDYEPLRAALLEDLRHVTRDFLEACNAGGEARSRHSPAGRPEPLSGALRERIERLVEARRDAQQQAAGHSGGQPGGDAP